MITTKPIHHLLQLLLSISLAVGWFHEQIICCSWRKSTPWRRPPSHPSRKLYPRISFSRILLWWKAMQFFCILIAAWMRSLIFQWRLPFLSEMVHGHFTNNKTRLGWLLSRWYRSCLAKHIILHSYSGHLMFFFLAANRWKL